MPFISPEHEYSFLQGAMAHRIGTPGSRACGARLRTGAACPNPPIKESPKGRCLSHCGPHAARAYRARQKRRFEAGSVSAAEWNRAEARRAANRLGDKWKKNPWLPGKTIDLGEQEYAFREALGGVNVDALPPAVADWVRWRYRRTQIDRQSLDAWRKALHHELPARVADAGPRPDVASGRSSKPGAAPRTWTVDARSAAGFSRRQLADRTKAPKARRGKGYPRPGRPRTQPADEDEFADLMRVYRENAAVLGPIMDVMKGEEKQLFVLRTLRDYLARPQDVELCKRWIALVFDR